MTEEPRFFQNNIELDRFLAKLISKSVLACILIGIIALIQMIRLGYSSRHLCMLLGAILSGLVLFIFSMQVANQVSKEKIRGIIPMLIGVSGIIPYIFSCYLILYEGIYHLKLIFDGYSMVVLLESTLFIILGYAVLNGIYKLSEFGVAVDKRKYLIRQNE